MDDMHGRLRAFVLVTCCLGTTAFGVVLGGSDLSQAREHLPLYAVLGVLVLLAELWPITVSRGDMRDEITVSSTFALALTLVGPLWLAMAVLAASLVAAELRSWHGAAKLGFNVAQHLVTLVSCQLVFCGLTGVEVLGAQPLLLPEQLPAALAAGFVFFTVNNCLAGAAAALAAGEPVLAHLRADLRFQVTTAGLLLTFAPVVAAAAAVTLWLVPLLLLPVVAIHRSAQLAADRQHEALHDPLTDLPNRSLFSMRVARACREGGRFAVLLVDLDHFKEINDTLGHNIGDELLGVLANRLTANLRPGDVVARLGGDEFAVLTADLDGPQAAMDVARRLLAALDEAFTVEDVRLDVQASLGIAMYPEHGDRMDLLLRRADIALYAAKVERGSWRMYDSTGDVHTPERLALAAELRDGLDRGELFLEYQPQLEVETERVVGFEALVRWQHPRHGRLMPDDFLPVVENTGLIGPLTLCVLDLALAAVARWRADGWDVTVAVNLSVRHLTDLGLPLRVSTLLDKHAVPPSALVLEVTETLIMNDPVRAVDVLALLRTLGVGLAVDDFGTGYSSLAYLRQLDIDELKIDKSFLENLGDDDNDGVIVRSTIELGHNLGLRIVAEGVEDDAALRLLRSWDCDVVQGYLFSRPLPSAAVLPWLAGQAAVGAVAPC
jgi:diguanylate cyclase (GGDEF)-like protein